MCQIDVRIVALELRFSSDIPCDFGFCFFFSGGPGEPEPADGKDSRDPRGLLGADTP